MDERDTDSGRAAAFFGHRPEEKVFTPLRARPPTVRVRVAQQAGALSFEPETSGQAELLRAVLAPKLPASLPLEFEPDAEEPSPAAEAGRELGGLAEGQVGQASGLKDLVELAAERAGAEDRETSSRAAPPQGGGPSDIGRPGVAGQAPARARPGETAAPALGEGDEPGAKAPAALPGWTPGGQPSARLEPELRPRTARSWISVFLSDAVGGRRRRRRSTVVARRSAILGSTAARALARPARRLLAIYERADALTSRARIPLANAFWSVLLTAFAWVIGVPAAWSAGFLGICLVLTFAGHPARNLLGFAGVMISSAAVAEIIRQRERFLEVFLSLFG